MISTTDSYPSTPGSKTGGASAEAARTISSEASELRELSFEVISREPSTADEVAARLSRHILAIRPRVSELRHEGHIEPTGTRRPSSTGNPQTVWRSTMHGVLSHRVRSLPVRRISDRALRVPNPCAEEIVLSPSSAPDSTPTPPIVVRGKADPAPARQAYVVGFLVSEQSWESSQANAGPWVALAMPEGEHTPDCVRGKWNGVGGKVEAGETYQAAMRREFREEAGLDVHSWEPVAHLDGDNCEIQFFVARGQAHHARQMEKHTRIGMFPVLGLPEMQRNLAPNVLWILLMALSADRGKFLVPFASKEVR